GIRAQVVHPHRMRGRAAHRADEDVTGAVLDPHERRLADRARLVPRVRDDDDRQSRVAQRGALRAAAPLVEVHLLAHPVSRTRNVFGHHGLCTSSRATRLKPVTVMRYVVARGMAGATKCPCPWAGMLPKAHVDVSPTGWPSSSKPSIRSRTELMRNSESFATSPSSAGLTPYARRSQ